MQPYAELLRNPQRIVAFRSLTILVTNGMGMALDTEAREEIEALYVCLLYTSDAADE